MNFVEYGASLLPTVKRDQVVEDCNMSRAKIKEAVIPAYESAEQFFKSWKFKSKEFKELMDVFNSHIQGSGNDNMITTILKGMGPTLKNLDEVEELVKKTYSQEVAGGGLTYMKSNLLQYVECVEFVGRYAIKLLNYAYICETSQYENGDAIAKSLSKAEIEWLDKNMFNFCLAFRVVTGNPGQVRKQLLEVPDVVVAEDTAATLAETMGIARLDPFQMRFIPIQLNPIYHIRMYWAKRQADSYRAMKEELALIQLRKLNLEMTVEGKPDAATQKQLKYMTERCEDLNFQIAKAEKDYA